MPDALRHLANEAGVATSWQDFHGKHHEVAPETLKAVLRAIDIPVDNDADAQAALHRLRAEDANPPLITATVGQRLDIPGRYRIRLEGGALIDSADEIRIHEPGYHCLETARGETTIAVAPARCRQPRHRGWGVAVQLYSLRRQGDGGLGDFDALKQFVRSAGAHGADAVAISPVHAQFSADPDRFSPYAPSSRVMLNVLHAGGDVADPELEQQDLCDWPRAARARLAKYRTLFESGHLANECAGFRRAQGERLEAHARFEALHAHIFGHDRTRWHWRDWPEEYRSPSSPAVQHFAEDHEREVAFHAFLQFLADRGLKAAQAEARAAGMSVGLICDLAVGADGGGSQCWSRQAETLLGLSIGAPPDLLSPQGQDWGLSAFSPHGLRRNGYGAFIEMLGAAMRHAGGVRIDHVMGLQRLWVIPEGAPSSEGAYLRFPVDDLLRLIALESHRNKAIVLGEDLGTVPDGFQPRIADAGIFGMRVLWFERDRNDNFTPPATWTREATALTSTHDLPPLAGWWSERDLHWRGTLGLLGDDEAKWFEHENRARDRQRIWSALQQSGAADGDAPLPDQPKAFVDAACTHTAGAACDIALFPIEDVLGLTEQPNLPGTLDEHPNWRRRLPTTADTVLETPDASARLAEIARKRAQ